MKIACVSNRKWAIKIYEELKASTKHKYLIIKSNSQYNKKKIISFNPDFILFYGWGKKVDNNLVENYKCLMLHPSPLPKYRGGSPIQNQIIRGETKSAVTIFRMNHKIDAGKIYSSEKISLKGSLEDIFNEIIEKGVKITKNILLNKYKPFEQDDSKATFFKRRKPKDSEITIDEIKNKDIRYLYNKIRMLADPYPNAFISTMDGKKLFIKSASLKASKKILKN